MKHTIEYNVGRYQIRINFWFLIIFLLGQTLLNELGYWQLNRAKEKQHRLEQLEAGGKTAVSDLGELTEAQIEQFQLVNLELLFSHKKMLYLDNKIYQKRPGYHILQVAKDSGSNKYLLVNRGWVFAGESRNSLPELESPSLDNVREGTAENTVPVIARVYPLAEEAISTESAAIETFANGYRLPVLDLSIKRMLEERLGVELENYILRLNPESKAALQTNWVWTNMPPEKHLAYAIQWYALALAFLVVSFIVCIKKR